jgi:predicted DCC family thiol-disulfide oxidoreductase YuxK
MADLVLYDGVCGLCDRLVRFLISRDRRDRFRFAALQSPLAAELLRRHGRVPGDLDTVWLVAGHGGPEERLLGRAQAVLRALETLGGGWGLARAFRLVPSRLLDALYDFVAARRYRWFGRAERCVAPRPEHRSKFLDAPGP